MKNISVDTSNFCEILGCQIKYRGAPDELEDLCGLESTFKVPIDLRPRFIFDSKKFVSLFSHKKRERYDTYLENLKFDKCTVCFEFFESYLLLFSKKAKCRYLHKCQKLHFKKQLIYIQRNSDML